MIDAGGMSCWVYPLKTACGCLQSGIGGASASPTRLALPLAIGCGSPVSVVLIALPSFQQNARGCKCLPARGWTFGIGEFGSTHDRRLIVGLWRWALPSAVHTHHVRRPIAGAEVGPIGHENAALHDQCVALVGLLNRTADRMPESGLAHITRMHSAPPCPGPERRPKAVRRYARPDVLQASPHALSADGKDAGILPDDGHGFQDVHGGVR